MGGQHGQRSRSDTEPNIDIVVILLSMNIFTYIVSTLLKELGDRPRCFKGESIDVEGTE